MTDEEELQEDIFVSSGDRERRDPGNPITYIIGFGGVVNSSRATNMSIVVRKVIRHYLFSYYWVDEIKHDKSIPADEDVKDVIENGTSNSDSPQNDFAPGESLSTMDSIDKSVDKLPVLVEKRPLLRSLSSRALSSRNSKKDDGHSSDEEDNDAADSIQTLIPKRNLSDSENQFFDMLRMRMVEVCAAEERAMKFARRLWSSYNIRRDPKLQKLTSITIVPRLAQWFFESLCKGLVKEYGDADRAKQLFADMHQCDVRVKVNRHRISGMEVLIENTIDSEKNQHWYGKALLTPQDRLLKQRYKDSIIEMRADIERLQEEIYQMKDKKEELIHEADHTLARIELCGSVLKNTRAKLLAARYKQSLMGKMTLQELKRHMGANQSTTVTSGLSDEILNKIRIKTAASRSSPRKYHQIDNVLEPDQDHTEERRLTMQMSAESFSISMNAQKKQYRKSSRLPSATTRLQRIYDNDFDDASTENSEMETKKSYRKQIGINPIGNLTPLNRSLMRPSTTGLQQNRISKSLN
jgi:hypothetical protein